MEEGRCCVGFLRVFSDIIFFPWKISQCTAKLEPAKWKLCTHISGAEPTFKSRASKKKWSLIYELEGKAEANMREVCSVCLQSNASIFLNRTFSTTELWHNHVERRAMLPPGQRGASVRHQAPIQPFGGERAGQARHPGPLLLHRPQRRWPEQLCHCHWLPQRHVGTDCGT
jgi:hypothetical protein